MELIQPQLQRVWKLPAAINFSLGGIGIGYYLAGLLVGLPQTGDSFQTLVNAAVLKLLGPALVGFGFLALTTEAGRPQRGINLLRHLRRSWMSRETLAAAIFIPFAVLDWLLPMPVFRILAALAALGLMVCQGFIVYRARGVTAWNSRWMPILFFTSGLSTGIGLMLAVNAVFNLSFPLNYGLAGVLAGVLNLAVWLLYTGSPDKTFKAATAALRGRNASVFISGIGHLAPAVLLSLILLGVVPTSFQPLITFASGLALVAGGVAQKFLIILKAGYLRAIVLVVPHRSPGLESSA